MADEVDPCECLCDNDIGIRRLLHLIRNSQAYCSDIECTTLLEPRNQCDPADSIMLMFILAMVMFVWYIYRPRTLRVRNDQSQRSEKQNFSKGGPNNDEPPAPPTIN